MTMGIAENHEERNPFNSRNNPYYSNQQPQQPHNLHDHLIQPLNEEEVIFRFEENKNAINYIVAVLLWKKPLTFIGLIISWILLVNIISTIWSKFSVLHILCIIAASSISLNYIFHVMNLTLFHFSFPPSDFLGPQTYPRIMSYITTHLNQIIVIFHNLLETRNRNILMFTYQSLTAVICVAFFGLLFSDKFLIYFVPIGLLATPGLAYNSVFTQLYRIVMETYHKFNAPSNANNNNINQNRNYEVQQEPFPANIAIPHVPQENRNLNHRPQPQINPNAVRPSHDVQQAFRAFPEQSY